MPREIVLTPEQKERANEFANTEEACYATMEQLALRARLAQEKLWKYLAEVCPETKNLNAKYNQREGKIMIADDDCQCQECRARREHEQTQQEQGSLEGQATMVIPEGVLPN